MNLPASCHQATELKTTKSTPELADIFRIYGEEYLREHSLPLHYLKVIQAIKNCRTSALGGHAWKCLNCEFEKISYNSCRDRHCPKCQGIAREKWLLQRQKELLPASYYHVVFTVAHELNPVILCNKRETLDLLFRAVKDTLNRFAQDPQWRVEGKLGFLAVLHTWSQTLMDHFHLHVLIPAGVIDKDNQWQTIRESYLFKNTSLASYFRQRYLTLIQRAYKNRKLEFPGEIAKYKHPDRFNALIQKAKAKDWNVYAKPPFDGPEQVIKYLGRYTHRVAISNHRILSIEDGIVTFTYRNRRNNNEIETMSLKADEFIRRFLLHILPEGFMKIRYFGFLSNTTKRESLQLIRNQLGIEAPSEAEENESTETILLRIMGIDITQCPRCRIGELVKIALLQSSIPQNSRHKPP